MTLSSQDQQLELAASLDNGDDLMRSRALTLIFATYRVTLASLLLLSQLLSANSYPTAYIPQGFYITAGAYCLFSVIFFIYARQKRSQLSERSLFISFAIDILILISIASSAEHMFASIGLLVIVALAGANLLISARFGLLLAAIAALFPLVGISLFSLRGAIDTSQQLFNVAVLGASGFFTALFMQYLSSRMARAQQLAHSRKADIEQLQRINEKIVARMRTGVLVLNEQDEVAMINSAARELLDIDNADEDQTLQAKPSKHHIPRRLYEVAKVRNTQTLHYRSPQRGLNLRLTATPFGDNTNNTLIFIEDTAKLTQHAQQLKLASLGRFTASIAHEIRNPLAAIHHAAQLMAEDASNNNQASVDDTGNQRMINIIQNNAARMNEIVENILQLSRRQGGSPELIDLQQWIESLVEEYREQQPLPLSKALTIQIVNENVPVKSQQSSAIWAKADPQQLHQVVVNMLDNAVLHAGLKDSAEPTLNSGTKDSDINGSDSNSEDKARWIRLVLSRHEGSGATLLDICDSGNGVASEHRDKLFEPFFTTSSSGTGLGLYICKELCESNQIHLSYQHRSNEDHGFRLQFAPHKRGELLE